MVNPSDMTRLDVFLVETGRFSSRARAQAAISDGKVRVDGAPANKPSTPVSADSAIEVSPDVLEYVSRGAVKLEAALRQFGFDPNDRMCLDVGASTGGFTEVLLRRGAARVYCVDVGHGQLDPRIAADPRVVSIERQNARELTSKIIPEKIEAIVCDVSFISLKLALPPALALAGKTAFLVALVKPQFEVGRERIGKGGVVKASAEELLDLARDAARWIELRGWSIRGVIESPIKGGDGNTEFLIGATRQA